MRTRKRRVKKNTTKKTNRIIILDKNISKKNYRDEQILSNLISNEVSVMLPSAKTASANSSYIINNIFKKIKKKNYSPSVNEKLNIISNGTLHNMFGCKEMDELMNDGVPMVKINNKCLYYNKKEVYDVLLSNLEASRKVKCSKIITPRQAQSNCWFNTMFVMFFISDKGRKFFKYFRAMMILGVKGNLITQYNNINNLDLNKKDVLSRELHKSFFLLNLAIEACLTGNKYAYALNTNDLILQIHNAIINSPGGTKYINDIIKPEQLGNPFRYYYAIMSFLSDKTIRILDLYIDKEDNNFSEEVKDEIAISNDKPPHLIMVTTYRKKKHNLIHPKIYEINGLVYELDAALILSDDQMHWTCLLTCNNEGYAYDGGSFTSLVPFNWKKNALNSSITYRFKNNFYTHMTYSFNGPSQTLLYYRIQ